MKLVVIESPYAGDVAENLAYLDRCVLDCLKRGESPYASHRMLTTALDDGNPTQRAQGIQAGMAFAHRMDARIFYVDRQWSSGMKAALDYYRAHGLSTEVRTLHTGVGAYP